MISPLPLSMWCITHALFTVGLLSLSLFYSHSFTPSLSHSLTLSLSSILSPKHDYSRRLSRSFAHCCTTLYSIRKVWATFISRYLQKTHTRSLSLKYKPTRLLNHIWAQIVSGEVFNRVVKAAYKKHAYTQTHRDTINKNECVWAFERVCECECECVCLREEERVNWKGAYAAEGENRMCKLYDYNTQVFFLISNERKRERGGIFGRPMFFLQQHNSNNKTTATATTVERESSNSLEKDSSRCCRCPLTSTGQNKGVEELMHLH